MSQETPISSLGNNSMNHDDSRLVDSILNDLNNNNTNNQQPSMPTQGGNPQGGNPQELSPEQHREMLEQRQHEMMQQQMMQQQMMMQQQQMQEEQKEIEPANIIEKIQAEWKSILLVVVLSVAINTEFIDNLFKLEGNTFFIDESGGLNIKAVVIKALVLGIVFFLLNINLPN
jgi:hypothetical protein